MHLGYIFFYCATLSFLTIYVGAAPKGGGHVEFQCNCLRELQPIHMIDAGLVKRVRGTAFCAKISPTILTRVIDSTRAVLNHFIPDVYINSDHFR
jgi:RNA 3'-terminal phosphate cyclase-like protein